MVGRAPRPTDGREGFDVAKQSRVAYDKVLPKVRALAEAIAEPLGGRVVAVDFVMEGGHRYLRVTVQEAGHTGVGICEKVNRALGKELDRLDLVPGNYFLEVSSPGVVMDAAALKAALAAAPPLEDPASRLPDEGVPGEEES